MKLYFLQGISKKPSRWTYMSELITLIRREAEYFLQATQPPWATRQPLVTMSVLHHLLGCIYTVP
jgi:hypothetical protein